MYKWANATFSGTSYSCPFLLSLSLPIYPDCCFSSTYFLNIWACAHACTQCNLGIFFRMILEKKKANTEWLMDISKRIFFSRKNQIQTNLCVNIWVDDDDDDDDREIYALHNRVDDHIWRCCAMVQNHHLCDRTQSNSVRLCHLPSTTFRRSIHRKMHLDLCPYVSLALSIIVRRNPFRLMTKAQCFYCLTNDNGIVSNRNKPKKCMNVKNISNNDDDDKKKQ